jgi:lipopolysaccharide/colanic/teichoic acid biosynthesis glycosyltransferase
MYEASCISNEADTLKLFADAVQGMKHESSIYRADKRLIDIVASICGLVIAIPIIVIFGILIKLETPGPAIFKQDRVGFRGKVFTIYKLRSMGVDAEENGAVWATKNDARVTKIGKFIRNTRIDELPQLFNILKGNMTIIGPRPERPEFTMDFEKEIPGFIHRVSVKPGLTGWAQINGGYDISPKEKLEFDMHYINNRNFMMDAKILIKTIIIAFTGEGAR